MQPCRVLIELYAIPFGSLLPLALGLIILASLSLLSLVGQKSSSSTLISTLFGQQFLALSRLTEKLGGMSKRRGHDDRSQGHGSKRARPARKKHLYLVLDDWEKGYSIHQIDPDTMIPDTDNSDREPMRLPEPAAFRFVAPASKTKFAAIGSNIVVVSSGGGTEAPTLVYDTAGGALAVAPPLPGHLAGAIVAVAGAGGGALYAPTTLGAGLPAALEALMWAPCTSDAEEPWLRRYEWSWKTVAAPSPPPLAPGRAVLSHATHPDGRTVFVSTYDAADGGREDTCSFDAERGEWTRRGAWALPFRGQGHFDRELGAWVGLDEELGYVCACQIPSRRTDATVPPESDTTEERLFRGAAATLAYMGDSKFCLVESVPCEDEDADGREGRIVRVTMFGLKFDRKGKLRTTNHRTTSSYVASRYVPSFSPVAFWM